MLMEIFWIDRPKFHEPEPHSRLVYFTMRDSAPN